jgi:uncharacterized protein (DUF3084 family)
MKTVDLKPKELKQASSIMEKYRNIEVNLTSVQEKLEALDREREVLFQELENVRQEEEKFFAKIRKTLGNGNLDIYTMKYVID